MLSENFIKLKINIMEAIKTDDIEVQIANAQKPSALSNYSYPFNDLDDRIFEILTYSIFKKRIETEDFALNKRFDDVSLMQGVGEKGMDCILTKNHKIGAVIQCKKYSKNLSDIIILEELIKFSIHFFLEKTKFSSENKFKYFIATSTGYTAKALQLAALLSDKSFINVYDFEKITKEILRKFKAFKGLTFEEVKYEIPNILSNFDYELLRPNDYNLWINNYPEIIDTFFEVKKVTDNSFIEKKGNEILNKIEAILSSKETESIESFIKKYKTASIEKLNLVNFIGFDLHRYRQKPTDITLTELFVQPSFHQRITDKNKKVQSVIDRDLKIANVFKSEKNVILLGDPGAGKSLLVKFIMVQILNGNEDKIGLRQYGKYNPFRIELRKYNEVRENKTILEYLSEVLEKEYQTSITIVLLSKLIQNSQSIIFFDGLDEIFNVTHKNKMKECIELFSSSFPKSKCIVTSRFIGYHDIKFNSKKFDEFAIQRFTQKQTKELITKFYSTQIANTQKRDVSIDNCLSQIEKEVDFELKSNPLIMTLILILTSNNIVIPDSKLEIYEACTKTLVDSIDTREKEMKFEMPIKNKRLTFAHLAYWQYESLSKNEIISYDKAIKSISKFLIEKKEVIEFTEAEEKSKKFLEYAEKRSIYFEDNFTHKTFLEYYTADYLYINYFTKASDSAKRKVISLITAYLPKSFWYIVFELLFTRIDKEQADSELLDEIFSKQIESNSLNVLYFLICNLTKIVNVSDDIKKKILKKTILLCIKGEKVTELRQGYHFEESSLISKINLLQNNENTFDLLQQIIVEFEEDGLSEKDLIEFYIFHFEVSSLNTKMKTLNHLQIKNKKKLKELAYKDLHLYCQAIVPRKDNVIPINILIEQIEHFGTKSLFKDLHFRHRENAVRLDTFDIYLMSIIEHLDIDSFVSDYVKLLKAGIKHEQVLEHVKTNHLFFFHRGEGFEKLLKLFLKSVDKDIDEIILSLIKRDEGMKNAYEKFRTSNNNSKLKIIDKIFEKK
jgi:NACHT domain